VVTGRALTAATLLAALMTGSAAAQVRIMRSGSGASGPEAILEEPPAAFGVAGWAVGQWARYAVSENVGAPMPMGRYRTFSIVGQRGEQFWVETAMEFSGMASGQGPTRKTLQAFGPVREAVNAETYVLAPDSSVRRETLLRAGTTRRGPAFPQGWTRVGEEQVTVAAGAFRTVHWRRGDQDLWASADAGPIGVVKLTSPDVQLELSARGASGARSRIPYGGN
jgi:hypothetical protein